MFQRGMLRWVYCDVVYCDVADFDVVDCDVVKCDVASKLAFYVQNDSSKKYYYCFQTTQVAKIFIYQSLNSKI